jgi:hypothetical protein
MVAKTAGALTLIAAVVLLGEPGTAVLWYAQ